MKKNRPFRWVFNSLSAALLLQVPSAFAVSHSLSYGLDASDLVEQLVPDNAGITLVGTPTLTGFNGSIGGEPAYSSGSFLTAGSGSGIPFSSGLILSTGDIRNSLGPNNDIGISTSFDSPGSSLLAGATSDAVTLTFQFKSATPSFSFRYMFGSEEYNSDFMGNDAFAFVLTGPGADAINLAKVPSTTTDVSIASVNGSSNNQYFFDNSNGAFDIQYNGLVGSAGSLGLSATGNVQVDAIYTLSIVIADADDSAFDSALFLEGGSFVANGFQAPSGVPEPASWLGATALAALAASRLRRR